MHWIEICAVDCSIYYVNTRLSLPTPLGSGTPLPPPPPQVGWGVPRAHQDTQS